MMKVKGLEEVSASIIGWQDKEFGKSQTLDGSMKHLGQEVDEAKSDLHRILHYADPVRTEDGIRWRIKDRYRHDEAIATRVNDLVKCFYGELTDVFHMLLSVFSLSGGEIVDEAWIRHERNVKRTWHAPDKDGVIRHIE